MKTTYVLKELLVQYCCTHCSHTVWKTNKRSKLFPNEFIKECGNAACPSHNLSEPVVDLIDYLKTVEEVSEAEVGEA